MGFHILIVDDSKVTRMMIGRALKAANIPLEKLSEAENGQTGLERIRQEPPDVVIADINMPVMTGIEMIAEIRGDPELASLPVVVISTEGSATRIEELRSMGVGAYLRKPFTPERIRDLLNSVLGDLEHESGEESA